MRRESIAGSTICRSDRRRFLVLAPNWLGDVVMATPLLAALRNAFPRDHITVLCRAYASELLIRCPLIDSLATYDRKSGVTGAVRALRAQRPAGGWDIALVLPPSLSSALVALLAGCGRRIGYGSGVRRALLTEASGPSVSRAKHLSSSYVELAARLAGVSSLPTPRPMIVPPRNWTERVRAAGLAEPYAVLAAGAMYGQAKMWPIERYAALAGMISEAFDIGVVAVGTDAERDGLDSIVRNAGRRRNLAGMLGIGDLVSVLRGARVVVGNDSGPVHISAAMGVPTVTVFGSTSPVWTSPRGPRTRIVAAGIDCSPCYRRTCPDGAARCLENIGPEAVLEAVFEALREPAPREDET